MDSSCPKCKANLKGVFPHKCPHCGFDVSNLAGLGTSFFQKIKWKEHTDLLYGDSVELYGKTYNASFNYMGIANLEDMVRFTLTFGDTASIKDSRGIHDNFVILSYFPEIFGSGSAIHYPQLVPCSGLMIISPSSSIYAHTCPLIDEWVQATFPNWKSQCKLCRNETAFGQPICADCYNKGNINWTDLLNP